MVSLGWERSVDEYAEGNSKCDGGEGLAPKSSGWKQRRNRDSRTDQTSASPAEMFIELYTVSKILEHVLREFVESLTRYGLVITKKETKQSRAEDEERKQDLSFTLLSLLHLYMHH